MAEERTQRRLAAILAADVVGYSRLMQLDEAGTLAALKSRRTEVLQPVVAKHRGRVVKLMGDGVLIEFASAVDAVECAVQLQQAMQSANAGVPEEMRIVLRIGINLGDVMVEGGDLYGDGVNVAARLESLSEPGWVLISQAVFGQVRGKVPLGFQDLGEQHLKNMAEPVRVYRVAATSSAAPIGSEGSTEDSQISIAILPLTNMAGDAEQEYFADGLTEDLITALAKSRHLHVIARNTTFQHKNRPVSVQQVGREIGARYVVEGSVRRSANRVRVTAQLIDVASGAHVWAERFDRELADIFAVQDEIVHAISAQLGYALIDAAVTGRRGAPTTNLTAYDYLLRGRSAWRRGAVIETRDYYLNAIEADPNYATALAALAFFYSEDIFMQLSGESVEELAKLVQSCAERSIARGDGDSFTHLELGTAMFSLGKLPEARHHLELALSLNPYQISATINLGLTIAFSGRHQEGLAMIERVFQLEPRLPPAMRAVPFWIRCLIGDPDGAMVDLQKIEHPLAYEHLVIAACFAEAGREEEARSHQKAFEAGRSAWFDVAGFTRCFCKIPALPEDRERFLGGMRKLGYQV